MAKEKKERDERELKKKTTSFKIKSIDDLEKKNNLKPGIKEVIKDFNKDTKIIMPKDHDNKHGQHVSGDPLFAKKELEKDVKGKKILPSPGEKKEEPEKKEEKKTEKKMEKKEEKKDEKKDEKKENKKPEFAKDNKKKPEEDKPKEKPKEENNKTKVKIENGVLGGIKSGYEKFLDKVKKGDPSKPAVETANGKEATEK